jgi:hypothetical protein
MTYPLRANWHPGPLAEFGESWKALCPCAKILRWVERGWINSVNGLGQEFKSACGYLR